MTAARLTSLDALRGSADAAPPIRAFSAPLGHVPIMDANPRGGEMIPFAPAQARRLGQRSASARVNSLLKERHGGRWALKKAAEVITGSAEAGDRILSLQTAFGGGKTHALVALWHLAQNCEKIRRSAACADLRKLLGDSLPKKVNALTVFTNQTCDATQGRKTPQGVRTRTMCGEQAVQLGAKVLYETIRANDEKQTAPKGLFAEILKEAAPCLILLDEVAECCVAASAVKVQDSTLADQTISFLQELTESAQQVQGVAVVATLPASHFEDITHAEAVQIGQREVEDDQRRLKAAGQAQGFLTIPGGFHLEAFARKPVFQQPACILFVIHDEQPGFGCGAIGRGGRG